MIGYLRLLALFLAGALAGFFSDAADVFVEVPGAAIFVAFAAATFVLAGGADVCALAPSFGFVGAGVAGGGVVAPER